MLEAADWLDRKAERIERRWRGHATPSDALDRAAYIRLLAAELRMAADTARSHTPPDSLTPSQGDAA